MTLLPPHRRQNARPPIPDQEKRLKIVPLDYLLQPFSPPLTPAQLVDLQHQFHAYWQSDGVPATVWNQLVDLLGAWVFPDLARAQARERIGYETARAALRSTILYRVIAAPLQMMGPSRFLQILPKALASAQNYGTTTTWEAAPGQGYIELEDELEYIEYLQGSYEATGVELLKVPTWRVAGTVQGPGHYLFSVTW